MLAQITIFLIDTVVTFFVYLLLARFHFQWLRAPFHNPAGEFILAGTSWLVMPVRRVIPGLAGLDIPTLLLAWVIQTLGIWAQIEVIGGEPRLIPIAAVALVDLMRFSVYILMAAVLVQAVLSWFHTYTPFASVLDALTRIFLRPLRRLIPPLGGFDLSPLVLLVLLQVLLIPLSYGRTLVARML